MTAEFDARRYKEATRAQWQAAADAWQRRHPTLQDWLGDATDQLLDIAHIGSGDRVLDIAAGAGQQSMQAARRVGSAGIVLATDLAPNILEYAAEAARAEGLTNLETRVMDAEAIDLPDASFDAIISRLGLMFLPHLHTALTEMYRVLTPGGRIAAMVFSVADANPFFSLPISIIRRRAGLPAPVPGQPGPFSLGGAGVLADAYRRAGFVDPVVRTVSAPLRLSSAQECVRFERESFGALHQMLSGLTDEEQDAAWQEIEEALHVFEGANGFEAPCEVVVAGASKAR